MEREDLNCQLCNAEFDSASNLPRILPECNHTICSFCLDQLLDTISDQNTVVCPISGCGKLIPKAKEQEYSVNNRILFYCSESRSLLSRSSTIMMDDAQYNKNQLSRSDTSFFRSSSLMLDQSLEKTCLDHGLPLHYICKDEKKLICEDCILIGPHRNHSTKDRREFQMTYKSKLAELRESIKSIKAEEISRIDILAGKAHEKKQELLNEIETHFEETIKNYLTIKQQLQDKIKFYYDNLSKNTKKFINKYDDKKAMMMLTEWGEKMQEKLEFLEANQEEVEFNDHYLKEIDLIISTSIEFIDKIAPDFKSIEDKHSGIMNKIKLHFQINDIEFIKKRFHIDVEEEEMFEEQNQSIGQAIENSLKAVGISAKLENDNILMLRGIQKSAEKLTDDSIGVLVSHYKKFSNINHFNLDFSGDGYNLTDMALTRIAKGFSSFVSLKTITLDLSRCSKLTDKGVSSIAASIIKIHSLQNLVLKMKSIDKTLTDKCLSYIGLALEKSSNLTSLCLDFQECVKISDDGINKIATSIGNLHKLKDFQFFGDLVTKISGSSLIALGNAFTKVRAKQINKEESLKKIRLSFRSCERIEDKSVTIFSESLNSLLDLSGIELYFNYCSKISDKSISDISKVLSKTECLQNLALSFQGCNFIGKNPIQFGTFVTDLTKTTSLQRLTLNFSETLVDNGAIYTLCFSLGRIVNLTHLALRFNRCLEKIDDYGVSQINNLLTKFSKLKAFSLDMAATTVKNINSLGSVLVNSLAYRLTEFELNLEGCTKVTSDIILTFAESVSKLTSLNKLFLNFNRCAEIKTDVIKKILQYLNVLNAKDTILYMVGCFSGLKLEVEKIEADFKGKLFI